MIILPNNKFLSRIRGPIYIHREYKELAVSILNSWKLTGNVKYDSKRKYAERGLLGEMGVYIYLCLEE